MRTLLRIYSPAIVLILWAIVWAAGGTGDTIIFIGLAATGAAVVVHCVALFSERRPVRRRVHGR